MCFQIKKKLDMFLDYLKEYFKNHQPFILEDTTRQQSIPTM